MANEQAVYEKALQEGATHSEQGNWSAALAAYGRAVQVNPGSAAAYAGVGEACIGLRRLDRALTCYKQAVQLSRGEIAYLQKVADIQERLGQLSEAGRTYMAAGELALRRQLWDQAISNWERAVRLEPHLLGGHKRLAMTFQRQGNTRAAVREYLAIARILQTQGEQERALQMCRAALRLEPGNQDVRTAVSLIIHGEKAFAPEEEEMAAGEETAVVEKPDTIATALRQMATVFESQTADWRAQHEPAKVEDPTEQARHLAQTQLAEEIFRDEDSDEETGEMSKLERDALLGQGIDFQTRGLPAEAIRCYEQVVAAGLQLPALHFTLGYLHFQQQNLKPAQRYLTLAAQSQPYAEASQRLLRQLSR